MIKKKTIAQTASSMSFDEIYNKMNKLKIERDVIQRDINALAITRNDLDSAITKLNNIALAKRRQIVEKK